MGRKGKDKGKGHHHIPFFSFSFRVVALFFSVLLCLCYLSTFINPEILPFFGFFGLSYLPLLLIVLILLIAAIIRRSRSVWIPLIALLPSLFYISSFFRLADAESEQPVSVENSLKLLTYNVGRTSLPIVEFIEKQDADIVMLQEFRTASPELLSKVFPTYPYIHKNFYRTSKGYVGNIILSKLPLAHVGQFRFSGSTNMIIYGDINLPHSSLRIYNVHLESNSISLPSIVKRVTDNRDAFSEELAHVHEKVSKSSSRRQDQIRTLNEDISKLQTPAIICGDVNDTPMSYSYRKLSEGRKDTFEEAGAGFAATYSILWPLLRIDYFFVPESCNIISHKTLKEDLSDHYPVLTEITL